MKKIILTALASITVCAAARGAAEQHEFLGRLLDNQRFVVHNMNPDIALATAHLEDWRITVYQVSSAVFPSMITRGMWDGEWLNIPGVTPCYYIQDGVVHSFGDAPKGEAAWGYVVVLSCQANPDWFMARRTMNMKEVQHIVGLALRMGGNQDVIVGDDEDMLTVPEPASALLALAGIALLFRRGRNP